MKKKILFMVINMNVGGTEKALLNMIDTMQEDKYDITLLMLEKYGGFLKAIPKRVNVQYLDGYREIKEILNNPPKTVVLNFLKDLRFIKAFYLMFLFLLSAIYKERSILFNSLVNDMKISQNEYDVAIAYAGPMDFISFFITKKVRAKKKIQWIHFDVTKIGFNKHFALKIYPSFDNIYSVSLEANQKLLDKLPELRDKAEVFHNLISPGKIHELAKKGTGFKDNFSGLRILTVGRLAPEKGQDLAIKATAKLIREGYNIKWYCVGEGSWRGELTKLIERFDLKEQFVLLGSDSNPYTYINQCDIYVQPSRYEGFCITLLEAQSLSKPIVSTCVNGVKEQMKHGETGLITGINDEELYHAIKILIKDVNLRKSFSNNLLEKPIKKSKSITQVI